MAELHRAQKRSYEAGIADVFVAMVDPDPKVAGERH